MIFFSKAHSLTWPRSTRRRVRVDIPAGSSQLVMLLLVALSISLNACKEIWLNDPTPPVVNQLYYVKITGDTKSVYRVNEDGSGKIQVIEECRFFAAPKNGKLAYIKSEGGQSYPKILKLILCDADGSNPKTIDSTRTMVYESVELSDDATKMLVTITKSLGKHRIMGFKDFVVAPDSPLLILKKDGNKEIELHDNTLPSFSPDGKRVAYFNDDKGPGSGELMVRSVPSDNYGDDDELGDCDFYPGGQELSWSADGTMLIYNSKDKKIKLHTVIGGNTVTNIPMAGKLEAIEGVLSRNSKELLFSAVSATDYKSRNLYIATLGGTGAYETISDKAQTLNFLGAFSPDASHVAYIHCDFDSFPGKNYESCMLSIYDRSSKKDTIVDSGVTSCFYK